MSVLQHLREAARQPTLPAEVSKLFKKFKLGLDDRGGGSYDFDETNSKALLKAAKRLGFKNSGPGAVKKTYKPSRGEKTSDGRAVTGILVEIHTTRAGGGVTVSQMTDEDAPFKGRWY